MRCAAWATRWSPKAIWTWWPWHSWAFRMRWPPWAPPAPPTMCKSCFALPTRSSSALTATARAAAQRTKHWKPPCPTPATRAASNSCSCLPSTTLTASSAHTGSDAFARQVSNALPLNQFLIEAASAECDLGQAQGRAKLSSQARPLWNLLPDGAFKRLVLGELAQKIQIDTRGAVRAVGPGRSPGKAFSARRQQTRRSPPGHENPATLCMQPPRLGGEFAPSHSAPYTDRWSNNSGDSGGNTRGDWKRSNKFSRFKEQRPPCPPAHAWPPSTAPDQATRILLSQMKFMERLDNDDLDTSVRSARPHGPLFAWIESEFQDHGPQAWAVFERARHANAACRAGLAPHERPTRPPRGRGRRSSSRSYATSGPHDGQTR